MTIAEKKRRERQAVIEMDNVISEQLKGLAFALHRRHLWHWKADPMVREECGRIVKRYCRAIRIQRWNRAMTIRGVAGSLGLTA